MNKFTPRSSPKVQNEGGPNKNPSKGGGSNTEAVESAEAANSAKELEASHQQDREWVMLVKSGTAFERSSAYQALFEKYRGRVYGILFRIVRNADDATDGTQEVFLKALRSIQGFDTSGHFFHWIYRIAVNEGIDFHRRRKKRRERGFPEEEEPAEKRSHKILPPDRESERNEVKKRLEEALAKLPETHRTVFLLYSMEEMTYAEIADFLEVPLGTVMSRLFYARKKLSESLPKEWDPGGRKNRAGIDRKDQAQ